MARPPKSRTPGRLSSPRPATTLRRLLTAAAVLPFPVLLALAAPAWATPAGTGPGIAPGVDGDGTYLGTVTARTAAETLADGDHDDTPVHAIAHLPPTLDTAADLSTALDALVTAEGPGLPVLDTTRQRLAGWITHQTLLTALTRERS